ncbi:MAG: HAD family hydrolase [Mogibacterium sp.]|nr:HAD family hydrolase [Mogibacterium sp.]
MDTDRKDIRLIALDIDGTLLDSTGHVPAENRLALEEATDRGILVAIATGRVLSSLPEEILSIRGLNYAITSNGARIFDLIKGQNVFSNCIAASSMPVIIEIARANHLQLEAFWEDRAYIDANLYRDIDERGSSYRRREYVLRTRHPFENLYDEMLARAGMIENINIFFDDPADGDNVRAMLADIPDVTLTSSLRNNVEIGGGTTSKSNAIAHLAAANGIAREQVMCFGDAPNDIAMIEYAGIGVAMGNAWGGTKDHADYVAETNDEAGVGKTIRRFCL